MISPLIAFHFDEEGRYCRAIDEPKVPIFIFIDTRSKVKLLSNFVNKFVLGVGDVDDEGRITVSRRFLAHDFLVVCNGFGW